MLEATAKRACMRSGFPSGFLGGQHSPKGRSHWYLAHMPEGREHSLCDKLLHIVPRDLLEDAFSLAKEHWIKRGGTWSLSSVPMYRGYVFVVTRDAEVLHKELCRITLPVAPASDGAQSWTPLSDEIQAWFTSVTDKRHVIRNSTGVIVDGVLHVQNGPLVGQETLVGKVNRHKRCCWITVGGKGNSFTEILPLNVPFKS